MTKRLFILLAALFCVNMSHAQIVLTETFDTHPIQQNSSQRDYTVLKSIYSAGAQELSSEWISSDFSLDKKGRYSTGSYPPNASLTARSNTIPLPALEDNQKIILQLKGSFQTEYLFDPFVISVSTDEGENFKRIAVKSGRDIEWDEDFDLSEFAEKNVIISFNLISDERGEGDGLSLDSMDIVVALYPPSFSLRSGDLGDNLPRLVRTTLTRNFDINCVDAGRGGIRLGVNIENLNQENVEVYAYITQGNSSNYTRIPAVLGQYNDFYDEYGYYVTVPQEYVVGPHFRYYFEAEIPGIGVLNNPPADTPYKSKTVAICGFDEILTAFDSYGYMTMDGCGASPYMMSVGNSYNSNDIKICQFFYREQGSSEAYSYVNMKEDNRSGTVFFGADVAIDMYKGIECYYYAENNNGTQFFFGTYEMPRTGIFTYNHLPFIYVYDDQYDRIEWGASVNTYFTNYDKPLTKTFIIINGTCSYLDLFVYNITSSNNHFSVSPVDNVSIPRATGYPYYPNYQEYRFEITYDAKEDAVSTITINNSSINYPTFTFTVIGKVFYDCPPATLSSNPITSKSHTLTFTLSKASQTTIFLFDKEGYRVNSVPPLFDEMLEAGEHKVPLKELFKYSLDPLTPYILVIETEAEKTLMYIYVSKI